MPSVVQVQLPLARSAALKHHVHSDSIGIIVARRVQQRHGSTALGLKPISCKSDVSHLAEIKQLAHKLAKPILAHNRSYTSYRLEHCMYM